MRHPTIQDNSDGTQTSNLAFRKHLWRGELSISPKTNRIISESEFHSLIADKSLSIMVNSHSCGEQRTEKHVGSLIKTALIGTSHLWSMFTYHVTAGSCGSASTKSPRQPFHLCNGVSDKQSYRPKSQKVKHFSCQIAGSCLSVSLNAQKCIPVSSFSEKEMQKNISLIRAVKVKSASAQKCHKQV